MWFGVGRTSDGDEYGGTAPFSEPESRVLRDIGATTQPHVYFNVHSGTTEVGAGALRRLAADRPFAPCAEPARAQVYSPWDCRGGLPPAPHGAVLGRVTRALARPLGCAAGAGVVIGGYPACGTSMDYFFISCD